MNHILEATAWTLIHFCWQAAVIAVAFRIVSAALARRTSHLRYAAALAALLAMLVSAVITFSWQMHSTEPSPAFISTTSAMKNALVSGDFPRSLAPGIASTSRDSATAAQLASSLQSLTAWIDAFWVLGVLALAVRGVGGWWLIHRLRVSSTSQTGEAVRASFQRISAALGLRRKVMLRVSGAIASPVTIGALRAIVLLPVSAVTLLGPDELEVVLAHELAHVRRADFAWNLVQTLIETFFFFHPGVWWVSGRVRHERELCCDDLALRVCPNPVVYASALFHLEEQRSRNMSLAMALDGHQSPQTLRMRIARILGESMPLNANRSLRPFSAAAGLAAVVVLLIPAPHVIASLRPIYSAQPVVAVTEAPSLESLPALPSLENRAVPVPHPAPAPVAASTQSHRHYETGRAGSYAE